MGYFHDPDEEAEHARREAAIAEQAVHEWINDLIRGECLDEGDGVPWIKLEGEAFDAAELAFARLRYSTQRVYQELAEEALFQEEADETEFF